MTRVLVTGATGLIGRHSVAALVEKGLDVQAIARTRPKRSPSSVTWHACDVLDIDRHEELMSETQPTHLLHLAWVTDHGAFWNAPENYDWKNASQNLIEAFQKHGGRRVVMAGSCAEYDWTNLGDGVCREGVTPLKPHTLYGQVKVETYRWLCDFAANSEMSQAWGRVFLLFGAGESAQRLVPSIAQALGARKDAQCSSGTQVRDFMDARNVGWAFAALLMSTVEGAVNIASGLPRSIGDVAKALGEISGRPDLVCLGALADREDDPAVLVADVSRLRDEVGYILDNDDFRRALKQAYDHAQEGDLDGNIF